MVIKEFFHEFSFHSSIENNSIKGLHFDSRMISEGELFLAVKTQTNDGHFYINDAFHKGASICIVHESFYRQSPENIKEKLIPYDDLNGFIKKYGKRCLKLLNIPHRIAITGTNGKTTTKDFIYSLIHNDCLSFKSYKNYNNLLGLIYNIFRIPEKTETAVFEIGTNHPGEISELAEMIEPTLGVLTNIGYGHIEFFHTRESIAQEKISMAKHITKNGKLIFHYDDPFFKDEKFSFFQGELLPVSIMGKNDFFYSFKSFQDGLKKGTHFFPFPFSYFPFKINMALAICAAKEIGVSMDKITEKTKNLPFMNQRLITEEINGITIINDTYNANPDSMIFAFRFAEEIAIQRDRNVVYVLGDMLELGELGEELHQMTGSVLNGIKKRKAVFTFGKLSEMIFKAIESGLKGHFVHKNDLMKELTGILAKNDILCVKGSRGMKMEEIIERLKKDAY